LRGLNVGRALSGQRGLRPAPVSSTWLPLRRAAHHVDLAAAAAGANEPGLPVKHGRLRTVALGMLGGIGLDLVAGPRLGLHLDRGIIKR
jgi:hypothetical protein